MAWKCLLCVGFSALYLHALLTHFNSKHRNDERFHIHCGLDDCDKQFSKANSFCKHVRITHRQHLYSTTGHESRDICRLLNDESTSQSEDQESVETGCLSTASPEEDQNSELCSISEPDRTEPVDLHDLVGTYLIKIKEENRLTSKATQQIARATSQLFHTAVNQLKRRIQDCLSDADVNMEDNPGISEAFTNVSDPFDGLTTTLLQEEFYKSNDKFVSPRKEVLGKSRRVVKRNNKKRIAETEDCFYYIPILKSIQAQLSSPKLLQMILSGPHKSPDPDKMRDFDNGTFVCQHPLFSCDDHAIKILLYYDDVNIVNPLSNKPHSLGFVYYQLANLLPEYLSKIKSVHLVSICKKVYIKKYGLNMILQPLVKDLQPLGSDVGYPFFVGGGTLHLHGALLAVLADTPASQAMGGFKEGVGGARRKCRHCMANFEQMQVQYVEEEFVLRCREHHEKQLQKIEDASSKYLTAFYSKEYGINHKTKLLDAPFFDTCGQLPQDVMHVFLEGIINYHLKFLLNHYITEMSLFTLLDLNKALASIPLGYCESKDRPVTIKETDLHLKASTNLGQSAAQMHLLVIILPFILGNYVDMHTEQWNCFVSLLEIMAKCFSATISYATILVLKNEIKNYLKAFKDLYNARITPKLHYLVHLPTLMFEFGPLVRSWCMRYEAKHSYFKNLAKVIKNFKNLPLSLANRHQSMECADSLVLNDEVDPCPLFQHDIDYGRAKHVTDADEFRHATECLFRFHNIEYKKADGIFVVNSVSIHGITYKPGKGNYLLISNDGTPEYGRIVKIWWVLDHGFFFVLQVMQTKSFCEELNAFEIEEPCLPEGNEILAAGDISCPRVHHAHKFNGKNYIIRKECLE